MPDSSQDYTADGQDVFWVSSGCCKICSVIECDDLPNT